MDYRDIDNISRILKDRQAELARDLQREAWLREAPQARFTQPQLLVRFGISLLLVVILVAASVYLLT